MTKGAASLLGELHDRALDLELDAADTPLARVSRWGLLPWRRACSQPWRPRAPLARRRPPSRARAHAPPESRPDEAEDAKDAAEKALRDDFDRLLLDRIARMVKPRNYEIELVVGPDGRVTSAEFRGRGLTRKKRDRPDRLIKGLHSTDEKVLDRRFEFTVTAKELARRNPLCSTPPPRRKRPPGH